MNERSSRERESHLREYAMAALRAFLSSSDDAPFQQPDAVARAAWQIAEAMVDVGPIRYRDSVHEAVPA